MKGVCTNGTAPSVSSINRILRNRAAERAAAEFARAAGYGLYSAVSAAAGGGVSAPPYPFPWGTPLHHHHWNPSAPAGMTPSVSHSLPPALPTPPAAASSPNRPHPLGSSSDSISPQPSPLHPHHNHHHHHHQGLGSLPPGLAAFAAAAAAAAAAARDANVTNSSDTPHGSAADSVPGSASPAGSQHHHVRRSSQGKTVDNSVGLTV